MTADAHARDPAPAHASITRLETLAPALVDAFTTAPPPRRRAAIVEGCRALAATTPAVPAELLLVLRSLDLAQRHAQASRDACTEAAATYDERYLDAAERDEAHGLLSYSEDTQHLFALARLAAALAFLLDGDDAFDEAIYELLSATPSPTLHDTVLRALSAPDQPSDEPVHV